MSIIKNVFLLHLTLCLSLITITLKFFFIALEALLIYNLMSSDVCIHLKHHDLKIIQISITPKIAIWSRNSVCWEFFDYRFNFVSSYQSVQILFPPDSALDDIYVSRNLPISSNLLAHNFS